MRFVQLVTTAVLFVGGVQIAEAKDTRFWNLTAASVTHLQFSPPGKAAWGPDQCKNDKDGAVDHDERLKIVGLASGTYDARIADKSRVCIVRDVAVVEGAVFAIDEKAMTNCH